MLAFHNENLVILATPKTGTTALYREIARYASVAFRNPPGLKHTNLKRFNRFTRPTFSKMGFLETAETFAIVREPIEWLGSWYRYRHRDALVGHPNSTRDVSFTQFVEEWLQPDPAPFAKVGSQANFVSDNAGNVGVDHLYRFEASQKYLKFLSDRLNLVIVPEQHNVSPKMTLELSNETKTRLFAQRPRDFEIWATAQH